MESQNTNLISHNKENEYVEGAEGIGYTAGNQLDGNQSLSSEQRLNLVFFTAVVILVEIAAMALIQLVGVYRFSQDFLGAVTTYVGWSAYCSGLGVGFAMLIAAVAGYTHTQGIKINDWPNFESVLSKLCALMLIEVPLMGQVNTYTAMSQGGLGTGVEALSLIGAKISEALVSTICGYAAFSILLVVYIFLLNRKDNKDKDNEGS